MTHLRPQTRRPGFTLVEMLTVLAIIVVILAIAVPVWNAVIGNSGLAAAQNQIAAALTTARADAIYNRQTVGLFFYIDPVSNQTAMAEVQVQTLRQTDKNPPSNSSTFTPSTPTGNTVSVDCLEMVNYGDVNGNPVFYRDVILLPAGVGVALNANTYTYDSPGNVWTGLTTPTPTDRYMSTGCIMFAPDGTLTTIQYGIPWEEIFQYSPASQTPMGNLLCQKLGFNSTNNTNNYDFACIVKPNASDPGWLSSSVGLTIYDRNAFNDQHAYLQINGTPPPIGDGAGFNNVEVNATTVSNIDLSYDLPASPTQPSPMTSPPPSNVQQDKFIEENWLDQNGIGILVTPFNGALVKAK